MNVEVSPKVSERMRKQNVYDTKTESDIARACFALGQRYRKDVDIPEAKTRGDLVFKKHKLVVFIDGCFWHGCPRHYRTPKQGQNGGTQKFRGIN